MLLKLSKSFSSQGPNHKNSECTQHLSQPTRFSMHISCVSNIDLPFHSKALNYHCFMSEFWLWVRVYWNNPTKLFHLLILMLLNPNVFKFTQPLPQTGTKTTYQKQCITDTLALPIDTSTFFVHTLNTKTIRSNLNSLNTFTKETGSPNMKLVLIR
jgi:hypothetical protein